MTTHHSGDDKDDDEGEGGEEDDEDDVVGGEQGGGGEEVGVHLPHLVDMFSFVSLPMYLQTFFQSGLTKLFMWFSFCGQSIVCGDFNFHHQLLSFS